LRVQQPLGQLVALQAELELAQMPATQLWPPLQVAHVAPAVPHALAVVPCWQVPLESQQPLVQLDEEHLAFPQAADITASADTTTSVANPFLNVMVVPIFPWVGLSHPSRRRAT